MFPRSFSRLTKHAPTVFVSACCVLLDGAILRTTFRARTDLPLVSPWDVLPWWIFLLFGLATLFQIVAVRLLPRWLQLVCVGLHAFTAWGTALIVYQLGFGFDPFLHQAAEQHLAAHHSISLATPLYLGQYLIVWGLHALSRVSVIRIDQLLVPVASVLLIPLLQRTQRFLPIALFLLPISWFSFTIPFHTAFLCFVTALCLSKTLDRPWKRWVLIALGLLSLSIHPLMGIPCCLFVASSLARGTKWHRLSSLILSAGIPLGLLAGFGAYVTLQGAALELPTVGQIGTSFVALFGTAYRFSAETPGVSLLYGFLSLWPFALCLIGLHVNLKAQTIWQIERRMTAIGIFVSAILLACFVRLPGIIAHEQFEFPLRLLQLVPFFFLPDIAQLIESHFSTPATRQQQLTQIAAAIAISLIVVTQWFASYPQNNAIVHAYAPSVSRFEYSALDWIERERSQQTFIVLSHQLLAGAALQTRGFEQTVTTCHGMHLRYAIPTGDALYQDFLNLFRARDIEPFLTRLRTCYGDADLFVSFPRSWDPNNAVLQRLEPFIERQQTENPHLRVLKLRIPSP